MLNLTRSIAFNALFYLNTLVYLVVALPTFFLPYRAIIAVARSWARTSLMLLRVVAGLKYEVRGLDKMPAGPIIVAAKHQSAWETFAFFVPFRRPAYVYKRQLAYVPLFGWLIWKARQIPVDRGGKGVALASIADGAETAVADGRQVMIFPEGTRKAVGAAPDYKFGVTHLYEKLGVPCQPVALNSGMFWSRKSFIRRPGTVLVELLDPIPPGLPPEVFAERLKAEVEAATNRLIAESLARGEGQGPSP